VRSLVSRCRRLAAGFLLAGAMAQAAVPAVAQSTTVPPDYIVEYDSIHHPVLSRGGMVSSQNAVASAVGVDILRRGGNAVDAAVATALALAVTLPRAGNLGGGGFMLVYLAQQKKTIALEYYDEAPAALRRDTLLGADGKVDPGKRYSFLGVGVPGTPMGLYEAHRRYGHLPWRTLVAPALRLADQGLVVTDDFADILIRQRDQMVRDPATAAAFYPDGGKAPRVGSVLRQPDLAWTLRQLRDHGADAFYRGAVGDRLVRGAQAAGGLITKDDLASYRIREEAPLWSSYRGLRIAYMPPPSGGMFLAELMNLLERFPMDKLGQNSADSLHLIAEASKLVFADRARYAGGYPQYVPPADGLIAKSYAADRAAHLSLDRTLQPDDVGVGNPFGYESPETTHFVAVDAAGNAVSNTFTLGSDFGAHVMAGGTGFLLNDALANFAWTGSGASPNAPAPRKRVVSTISPVIVFKDDRPWLVSGTPGGARIFSVMAQLLVNLIDFHLNIAEASERPRIFQGTADQPIEFEPGFPRDMLDLLAKRGHRVTQGATMGSAQSIIIEDGLLSGAADTRRPDAAAIGSVP